MNLSRTLTRAPTIVASVVACAGAASGESPTAIAYTILHSDCLGAGVDTLTLKMNGTVFVTVPPKTRCSCGESVLVVTITDPALLTLRPRFLVSRSARRPT